MKPADLLIAITTDFANEISRGQGAVKWCKRCSRRHPARAACGLSQVTVPSSHGRMVKRLVRLDNPSKETLNV